MEQILIIAGVAIFGILGSIHLPYTFAGRKLYPHDEAVVAAMQSSTLNLTKETTIWKAWIGFNASHSYGAILFSAIYIPLTVFHFELIQQSLWFRWLPVLVGILYLVLAKQYWFRIPFTGILLATLCLGTAAVLMTV